MEDICETSDLKQQYDTNTEQVIMSVKHTSEIIDRNDTSRNISEQNSLTDTEPISTDIIGEENGYTGSSQPIDSINENTNSNDDLIGDNCQANTRNDGDKEEVGTSGVENDIGNIVPKEELKSDVEESDNFNWDDWKDDGNNYRRYSLRKIKKSATYGESVISETKSQKVKKQMNIGKQDNILECAICLRYFNSKVNFQNHLRQHGNLNHYRCALCKEEFKNNEDLLQHKKKKHTEKETYLCMKCELAFSDHCQYQIHNLNHKTTKLYQCEECDMQKENKKNMAAHIYGHYDRELKCEKCNQMFRREGCYKNHLKQHGSEIECVECGKICSTSYSYKYHLSTHTGVKLHQCPYCGRGFLTNGQKTVHARIHTNHRPYTCDKCPKSFHQSGDLKKHVVTKHNHEKKYECDYCHKRFLHKDGVRLHIWSHINYKQYKCPECSDRFTVFGSLRKHMLYWHAKNVAKTFDCTLCGKNFSQKNHFKRHCDSIKHKNKVYGEKLKTEQRLI